jgi:hypothetical protein
MSQNTSQTGEGEDESQSRIDPETDRHRTSTPIDPVPRMLDTPRFIMRLSKDGALWPPFTGMQNMHLEKAEAMVVWSSSRLATSCISDFLGT